MTRKLAALIVCLTFIGFGPVWSWSQEIVGRVNLLSGEDPGVVVVQIEDLRGAPIATIFTDDKGLFRFPGSFDDNLFLVIEHEGFKPVREEVDVDLRGNANIFLFLEPETDPNVSGGGVIDVRRLADIPDEAREAYEDAIEESEDGDHEDAIERLEEALELAPDYYEARIKLGAEHLELDQFREAEAAFEQAFELDPAGALAPLNLGALYYKEADLQAIAGDFEAAAATFQRAIAFLEESIRLNPRSGDSLFYMGATFYKLGFYEEAEQRLLEALELEEGHAQARLTLLNVYSRQSRYEDALEQADAFLEENPDSPQRSAIERAKSQIEDAIDR